MKIKVLIQKINNPDEKFSFLVHSLNIGEFFDSFFDYFENVEDITVNFIKVESEE